MDFKEALKAMENGREVQRDGIGWPLWLDEQEVIVNKDGRVTLSYNSYMADDWVLADYKVADNKEELLEQLDEIIYKITTLKMKVKEN